MSTSALPYSLVIATYERPEQLATMLASVAQQTRPPEIVIVVDSSPGEETRQVVETAASESLIPIRYERAERSSAAEQRNQGAREISTPLVAFADDDARLYAETMEKLCRVFDQDAAGEIGGVAGRIEESTRPVPRGPLWWYYRLQAGFRHPTYGGKLFGPAINCYPSYTEAESALMPADWLSSTCVMYRTELFRREQFPKFEGYSFMEDVHLSARVGKTHRLFFHRDAIFQHDDAPSTFKRNVLALARSRIRNQRLVARDVMGVHGPAFELKLALHRLFVTTYLLRRGGPGVWWEIAGTWF